MQLQIRSRLVEEIKRRHAESEELNPQFESLIIRKANLMRECGIYLQELKAETPHGLWQLMFATAKGKGNNDATFDFDYSMGQRYIKFANSNEHPFADIETAKSAMALAWKTQHAIDSGGHGPQGLPSNEPNFFITAGKQLQSFSALFEKQMQQHPVDQWAPQTAGQFVAQMEPIIEKVNGIYAKAKERSLAIVHGSFS